MAHRKAHRRHSRKAYRKASRKAHRNSRRQHGGGGCAAIPLQNSVFAQKGGMAPYEAGGNDLLMDKAAMVQAQSFDQLGMIQEAGRLAAAAQQGGRRRRSRRSGRRAHSARHRSRRHSRKSRKARRSQKQQRGGMSPFDADPMLLPKGAYAFTGVNPQWSTEASVQPALKMGAGPQAA
jgi:hypothetical protein